MKNLNVRLKPLAMAVALVTLTTVVQAAPTASRIMGNGSSVSTIQNCSKYLIVCTTGMTINLTSDSKRNLSNAASVVSAANLANDLIPNDYQQEIPIFIMGDAITPDVAAKLSELKVPGSISLTVDTKNPRESLKTLAGAGVAAHRIIVPVSNDDDLKDVLNYADETNTKNIGVILDNSGVAATTSALKEGRFSNLHGVYFGVTDSVGISNAKSLASTIAGMNHEFEAFRIGFDRNVNPAVQQTLTRASFAYLNGDDGEDIEDFAITGATAKMAADNQLNIPDSVKKVNFDGSTTLSSVVSSSLSKNIASGDIDSVSLRGWQSLPPGMLRSFEQAIQKGDLTVQADGNLLRPLDILHLQALSADAGHNFISFQLRANADEQTSSSRATLPYIDIAGDRVMSTQQTFDELKSGRFTVWPDASFKQNLSSYASLIQKAAANEVRIAMTDNASLSAAPDVLKQLKSLGVTETDVTFNGLSALNPGSIVTVADAIKESGLQLKTANFYAGYGKLLSPALQKSVLAFVEEDSHDLTGYRNNAAMSTTTFTGINEALKKDSHLTAASEYVANKDQLVNYTQLIGGSNLHEAALWVAPGIKGSSLEQSLGILTALSRMLSVAPLTRAQYTPVIAKTLAQVAHHGRLFIYSSSATPPAFETVKTASSVGQSVDHRPATFTTTTHYVDGMSIGRVSPEAAKSIPYQKILPANSKRRVHFLSMLSYGGSDGSVTVPSFDERNDGGSNG